MIASSALLSVVVPRALRMNLLVRLIIPWRLPAWAVMIFPVADTLNRFLQLDLVFILGISGSFVGRSSRWTRHASSGRTSGLSAPYTPAPGIVQGPPALQSRQIPGHHAEDH